MGACVGPRSTWRGAPPELSSPAVTAANRGQRLESASATARGSAAATSTAVIGPPPGPTSRLASVPARPCSQTPAAASGPRSSVRSRAGDDRADRAGEDVAGAGRCEPRRSCRDCRRPSARRRDDRDRSLEHDRRTQRRGGLESGCRARRVIRRRDLGKSEQRAQSRMLAPVRGDDQRRGRVLDQIERAGVDDDRQRVRQDAAEDRGLGIRSVGRIRSRPDQPRLHPAVGGHRLGAPLQHQSGRNRRAEVADHAHAGAPRRLDAQDRGARIGVRPGADAEHATGILVVGGGWPPKDARRVLHRP